MNLRRRVSLLYWIPVALLFCAGYFLDRRATAIRAASAQRQAEDLQSRFEKIESSVSDLRDLLRSQSSSPVPDAPPDTDPEIPRPRIMGSGRSGRYVYMDICLPSGSCFRYFLRDDASPMARRDFILRISEDVRADASSLSAKKPLDSNSVLW